ncbi:MAG: ImmA/IrrE family metallo-endopeptidase [Enterococcus faecalis]|nr:ImmA/IrrE family metallo-endopeptidase [Enterococcus faecalis]
MTPMYLDYDTYFEYHDQTYIIIEKVANYYGSFGDVSRKIFSGNIIKFHDKCGISYNPTMVKGRQNFSILHESAHYFFDMNKECKSQSFSDLITGKGYTSEDEPKEIRANIFASLALINNEALKECLTKIFLLNPCLARSAINQYRYNYNSTKLISYIKMCLC